MKREYVVEIISKENTVDKEKIREAILSLFDKDVIVGVFVRLKD